MCRMTKYYIAANFNCENARIMHSFLKICIFFVHFSYSWANIAKSNLTKQGLFWILYVQQIKQHKIHILYCLQLPTTIKIYLWVCSRAIPETLKKVQQNEEVLHSPGVERFLESRIPSAESLCCLCCSRVCQSSGFNKQEINQCLSEHTLKWGIGECL